jgi:type I restriction enzyme M protein
LSLMSQQELESRLWDAANALRGPVDPSDFKSFVFPILFFKWISDTWHVEHAEALAEVGPDISPEEESDYHRFSVPEGCHWFDVVSVASNLGVRLRDALDRLSQANSSTLAGIFGIVDWADKDRIPEVNLRNLLDAFNGLTLNRTVVTNDMLGAAYEYLLKQFADESGRKAGEFFTPRAVVHLLIQLLEPQPGENIYDPACGSGGMLVETSNAVRAEGGDTRTLRLYGQEVNLTTSAIARMNLYLHDLEDFHIIREDTLRDPRHLNPDGSLRKFDIVIANPPFSLKNWGQETWVADPFGRSFCGTPPASTADYAWIEHMVSSMASSGGRVGVVMPHGVLFRGGAEQRIRQCIIEADLLQAVVGLPSNLFYSTTIPACLLIFRATKEEAYRGIIRIVDGSRRFEKGRNQNRLNDSDVEAIVTAFRSDNPELGARRVPARSVTISEIANNGWDLSISRYVSPADAAALDVATALAQYREAQADLALAQEEFLQRLKAADYA